MEFEDSLVLYIDLLGTSEAVGDAARSSDLLNLLVQLALFRGEFFLKAEATGPGSQRINLRPEISTFSDHIVMSIPLGKARNRGLGSSFVIVGLLQKLLGAVAASALRIGFLVRGGATIGKLYHSAGVVLGDALVEAYKIESRTSVYPRVVVSPTVINFWRGASWPPLIQRDDDGLHYLDYFHTMMDLQIGEKGAEYIAMDKGSFDQAIGVVQSRVAELGAAGKLNELAKWVWFRGKWRAALLATPPDRLRAKGISPDALSSSDPLVLAR